MANGAGPETRRPVKVVMFSENELSRPPGFGGGMEPFDGFGPDLLRTLLEDLERVERALMDASGSNATIGVARVRLRSDAIAKSHKPVELLRKTPIIGGEDHKTLLIRVDIKDLKHLKDIIAAPRTNEIIYNISAIEHFLPYLPKDRLPDENIQELWPDPARKHRMKVRLFDYDNLFRTKLAKDEFQRFLASNDINGKEIDYGVDDLHLFSVNCDAAEADRLRSFVAVQSIQPFAQFAVLPATAYRPSQSFPDIPPPEDGVDYPVVGLIDTGISPDAKGLLPWVLERDSSHTPPEDQDNVHGTFIGGLFANARGLNDADTRFPDVKAKILDVAAIPKPETPLYENDLIEIMQATLAEHGDKASVWNLSVNGSTECGDAFFSHFAMALDAMQKRYGVIIVVSVGNTSTMYPWPDNGMRERILPPADSMLALTVGSVAHKGNDQTLCRSGQPSPFTRMGSGPASIPKPELTHYGGNCDANGDHCGAGNRSIGLHGETRQDIGTSYATPLVSLIAAALHHSLQDPNRRMLSKALVIHSAALRSATGDNSSEDIGVLLPYAGFGVPSDVSEILECKPWQATMIFQPEFDPKLRIYQKAHFPIPDCLHTTDGKARFGIVMTTVYEPRLLPSYGAEYSRIEIESKLGTVSNEGKFQGQVPPFYGDYTKLAEGSRIQEDFKWAPVSVRYQKIHQIVGQEWELRISATSRDGSNLPHPQKAFCIVTIYDLERENPNVYNQVVQAMTANAWLHQDIQVAQRIRL